MLQDISSVYRKPMKQLFEGRKIKMTVKEISDEAKKINDYWFNRKIAELRNFAKVREEQSKIIEHSAQINMSFNFDDAELKHLISLAQ